MLDETAAGVYQIAATPFLPDGSLDLDSVDRMVDFYVERGATGLTILGMMGEAPKLSTDESTAMIRRTTAATALPVVVGVSAPGFAALVALSKTAMEAGAAGVMIAPPPGLATDDEIVGYFTTAAEMLGPDIPWVLQDFPLSTGVKITPGVFLRIVAACPTCVMLKHEDWPGLDKITAIRRASDAGARRVSILCGNGGLFLPEEMARGADGAMTGFAFPEMMRDVVAAMGAGDRQRAQDILDVYLPLIRFETQPGLGLAIRKHVLAARGAIAHPTIRRPGPTLSPETRADLTLLLDRQAKRLAELT